MSLKFANTLQVREGPRLSDRPTVSPKQQQQSNVPLYSMQYAPVDGRRVFVADENGRKRRAMFDRNAWRVVGVETDRISGERRFQQTGDIVHQPRGWHWPQRQR